MFDFLSDATTSVGDAVQSTGLVGQTPAESFFGVPNTGDAATATADSSAHATQPGDLFGQAGQFLGDIGRGLSQEGLGGLLDPAGMMDRMQAQRDLSDRFQVLPDDFVGTRNHNQVTQAEYEDIAHTYSDVRMGRGDLTINTDEMSAGDATSYRDDTMETIADMTMTTAGRSQVTNMSNNVLVDDAGNARLDAAGNEQHHTTTIRAVHNGGQFPGDPLNNPMDQNRDGVVDANDSYTVANRMNANAYAGAAPGENRNDWFRPTNADGTTSTTRGAGTNSDIWWNPGVSTLGARDVIMAHEMNHAYHETQGTMSAGTGTSGPDNTIANFERQAVGLPNAGTQAGDGAGASENTYREQRNQLGLGERHLPRMSYGGGIPGQGATDMKTDAAWWAYHAVNPTAF